MRIIENKKTKIFYVVSVKTGELIAECFSMKQAISVKHQQKKDNLFI